MSLRACYPDLRFFKGILFRESVFMCALYVMTMSIPSSCNVSYYPVQFHIQDKAQGLTENADFQVRDFTIPCLGDVHYKAEAPESESEVRLLNLPHPCSHNILRRTRLVQALKVSSVTSGSQSECGDWIFSFPPGSRPDLQSSTQPPTLTPRRPRSPSPRRQCHVCKASLRTQA